MQDELGDDEDERSEEGEDEGWERREIIRGNTLFHGNTLEHMFIAREAWGPRGSTGRPARCPDAARPMGISLTMR